MVKGGLKQSTHAYTKKVTGTVSASQRKRMTDASRPNRNFEIRGRRSVLEIREPVCHVLGMTEDIPLTKRCRL